MATGTGDQDKDGIRKKDTEGQFVRSFNVYYMHLERRFIRLVIETYRILFYYILLVCKFKTAWAENLWSSL